MWGDMHRKRKARELAIRVLFLWDSAGVPDSEAADRAVRALEEPAGGVGGAGIGGAVGVVQEEAGMGEARVEAMDMARGAWLEREGTDKRLEFHAPQWPVKRQPGVDRAILRLAVWELGHTQTPAKVVIDEAIELAKTYGTENSPAFVNGVLDAVHRENTGLAAGVKDLPST